jgi:hypothetical protein
MPNLQQFNRFDRFDKFHDVDSFDGTWVLMGTPSNGAQHR